MMKLLSACNLLLFPVIFLPQLLSAQSDLLTLKQAVQTGLDNYGSIKAKANYAKASEALVKATQREYLPDLNISFQQDYGTVNGANGPLYGFKGLGTASSGPPLPAQYWHAAFGALYLANINWDFFSFGRVKEKINVSRAASQINLRDLEQEKFQQTIRVSAAYLNLLAAQQLSRSQEDNLQRAITFQKTVAARVNSGLNPGVDSSLANADVSNARIALTRARDVEQEQSVLLAQSMGISPATYQLDSFFLSRVPRGVLDSASAKPENHPLLQFYKGRILLSDEQAKYLQTLNYPSFSLFGIFQGRGTGFESGYGAADLNAYSTDYWKGINPTRSNYLFGFGMTWNLTTPLRIREQYQYQQFISKGLQEEYELANQQLKDQLIIAENKIRNALANYREAPVQVKAASDAWIQKSVLYKNGLSNIVDVSQALYALNRAETDRDIIYSNVWQALLLKAAATGDFGLFINEF